MKFDVKFYAGLRRAAELRNVSFSEFLRLGAAELARNVYRECGEDEPDLSGWHLQKGGDTSEARAKKDKNYKKRRTSDAERGSGKDPCEA